MNKKNLLIIISIAVVLIAFLVWSGIWSKKKIDPTLEDFAQCLRDKNIVMYGAEWCSWCQKEKANFGASFKSVPYVECPQEPQKCLALGIDGYPTWIFPSTSSGQAEGKKLRGYQGLEKLSRESGCELPKH